MAQEVIVGTEAFRRRNPVAVWIGLPLITLGVYHFVWYYKINNEARRYLKDQAIRPGISLLALLLGWLLIVPPYVSIYRTGVRVQRMQVQAGIQDRCEPWLALVLSFVLGLHAFYLQTHLNTVWDAHLQPAVLPPALPPPTGPSPAPFGPPPAP